MAREVYIDLEMTVIDNFQNGRLVNIERLQALLSTQYDRLNLRIFSFAIFNEAHKQDFLERLAPKIEAALGGKIIEVVTIEQMMLADLAYSGVRFDIKNGCDVTDWLSIRGKVDGFRNYVLNKNATNTHYVLIDDVVPNLKLTYQDTWNVLYYINIDTTKLVKEHESTMAALEAARVRWLTSINQEE